LSKEEGDTWGVMEREAGENNNFKMGAYFVTSIYQAKQCAQKASEVTKLLIYLIYFLLRVCTLLIENLFFNLHFSFSVVYIFCNFLNLTFFHLQNNLIAGTTYRIRCWL